MFDVGSRQPAELWRGEVRRLRRLLDVMSDAVQEQYGGPLTWRSEDLSAEQWRDPGQVAAKMERKQLRDDFGKVMTGGGARGVVQGYRDDLAESMTSAMWKVGAVDGRYPFQCNNKFWAGDLDKGYALGLYEHPVDWLVRLLCTSAVAISGDSGRIYTTQLLDAIIDERPEANVGALTLVPNSIDPATLPASITAYPCPVGYPDGVVLVADPERVVNDPESLVGDLLAVDDTLTARR
jgi:hypothetical protein